MNKIILIIIVVLLAVVGGYFLLKTGYRAPAPPVATPIEVSPSGGEIPPEVVPEVREVTVIGTEFSFSPASISVKTGEKVKLSFQNGGGALHNLVIEGLGISTKTIGAGKADTIEFTAPASGNYTFICSVPGHRAAGMEGQLKVE